MIKMDFSLINSIFVWKIKTTTAKDLSINAEYNFELTLKGESGFPHSISKVLIWTFLNQE